jgi:colicin import membrane protein
MAHTSERNEALEIIKSGRSVMFTVDGQRKVFTIDNIDELPTEVDLAMGNPEATEAALDNIEEQIKVLEEAKKRLAETKKEQKAEAKAIEEEAEEAEKARKAEAKKAEAAKEEEEAPKASAKKEESK